MNSRPRPRPLVLCILDGWGERPKADDNAIETAHSPNWHRLKARWPHAQLQASEHYVGLPDGQMGNSEVGHTNIGAGRVVMQDLPRIDKALAEGKAAKLPGLQEFIGKLKKTGGTAHVMGLISPGGVHSHQKQIAAFARIVAEAGVPTAVHAFLDGRDTPPQSAAGYLKQFQQDVAGHGTIRIATVAGRYYAMDRDKRWDRVAKAYRVMTAAAGERADDPVKAVEAAYARGETDEFVLPTAIADYQGMRDGDGLFFANFRADRIRQIAAALLDPDFSGFEREKCVAFAAAVGLVEYSTELNRFLATLFPPEDLSDTFGEIVADAGMTQLRIAETEKYAHVTFFFNGGRETVFPGEERILVPSPRDVKTYDLKPEMSAEEVTQQLEKRMCEFGFVLVNYANPDMVGHTGVLPAALKAVAKVDECIGRLWSAAQKCGMAMVVTADHGNIETMIDPETGEPFTAHTLNPVPIYLCDPQLQGARLRRDGILADVAPTLLQIMGLPKPAAMSGKSLLQS